MQTTASREDRVLGRALSGRSETNLASVDDQDVAAAEVVLSDSLSEHHALAWDAFVADEVGNPTQVTAFSKLGGRLRKPVFIRVGPAEAPLFQWLMYRSGVSPGGRIGHRIGLSLVQVEIRSEPTLRNTLSASQIDRLIRRVLETMQNHVGPWRIRFQDIVWSRWLDRQSLESMGYTPIAQFGSIVLDLTIGIEALRSDMHKKQRNMVNRGESEGLVLYEESNAAGARKLIPLLKQVFARSGSSPTSDATILQYADTLCASGLGRIFLVARDGVDYGASFELEHGGRALGWLGAAADDAPKGTGNFMQWSIIELFANEGCTSYDLGGVDMDAESGSKGDRILRSKERYGGQLVRCYGGTRIVGQAREVLMTKLIGFIKVGRDFVRN